MRKTNAAQPTLFSPDPEPSQSPAKRPPRTRPTHSETLAPAKPILAAKAASKAKSVPTKTIPVRVVVTPPMPVRAMAEKFGAEGYAWRMSGKHAVAYLRNAILAGELLATDSRHLAKAAMAVYYDRKGKAFAWQVRFDAERWDEVIARLG